MKRILQGLAILLLVVLLGLGGGLIWLRGSLPQREGRLALAGLEQPVELLRDADGLLTIRAETTRDAAFALGFAHAQDRLWQMDFMRRAGAGRLSEVTGPETFDFDRLMRTLGFYRLAEASLAPLSAPLRAELEAYAAGVNAFLADRSGPLPPEFLLLGYEPAPWRPADSLVWNRLIALQLSGNWEDELLRARLARHLSPAQVDFLWPDYPLDGPVTLPGPLAELNGLDSERLRRLAALLPWEWAPKDASNAWVLAGTRTRSGRPILANDPHLALGSPGLWYLVRIETPGLLRAGATTPGVPFLVLGHNGHIAWGFTTTHSDTQDLFVERLDPADPGRYLAPGGARPFETRSETIAIKGEAARTITVRTTRHGPVISDAATEADAAGSDADVLALSWPGLREDDRTTDALYNLNRATDWSSFRAALRDFHSPQQNIVYADTAGDIGFVAPGRVPLRKAGDGRAPVPGWSGDFDWTGFIPYDELPVALNPANARLITANNKIVPDSYPYLLTADWPAPFRAARITDLIESNAEGAAGLPLEANRRIQLDFESLGASALLDRLRRVEPESVRGHAALALLAGWTGAMDRERPEPLLFYAWMRELNRVLLADELGPDFAAFQSARADLLTEILEEGSEWCDDVTTGPTEDCATQLNAALEAALDWLAQRFDKPLSDLRWGEAHMARFEHPIFSRVSLLGKILSYAVETDGDSYTVNTGGMRFKGADEALFENLHGPGYRAIYDLADLDQSLFIIATGQSGNPLSAHWGDLAPRWRDGHYVKLVGDETVESRRLVLTPR